MKLKRLIFGLSVLSCVINACDYRNNKEIGRLITHAGNLLETAPDSALLLLNQIEASSLSDLEYSRLIIQKVRAKRRIGIDITGDSAIIFKARDYLLQAKDPESDVANVVTADLYSEQGNYVHAVQTYQLAKQNIIQEKRKEEQIDLMLLIDYNMGSAYYHQGLYRESLSCLNDMGIYSSQGSWKHEDQLHTLELQGLNYLYLSKLDSALDCFNKAEKFAILLENTQHLLYIVQNTSLALCEAQEYKRAKEKCIMAIGLVSIDDYETLGKLQIIQSYLYDHASQNDSAYICISKAYDLLKDTDNDMIELYRLFSSIEEKRGNYKQALHYNKLYLKAKDTAEENKLKYKKANQDSNIQKIQQERDAYQKSKRDLYIVIGFLGMALLLALLVMVFFINRERSREKFKELKNKFSQFRENINIEKTKLERELGEIQQERAREQELFQQEKMLVIEFHAQINQEKIEAEKEKLALQAELIEFKEKAKKEKEECEKEVNTSRRLCNEEHIRFFLQIKDIAKLSQLSNARHVNSKEVERQMDKILKKMTWYTVFPTINSLYDNLIEKIQADFQMLTEIEFRLFCLACAGFRSSEIFSILNNSERPGYTPLPPVSISAVNAHKTVVRKKVGIESYGSFKEFVYQKYGIVILEGE